VLGIPFCHGQGLQGVDQAPAKMIAGGLLDRITQEQWKTEVCTPIAVAPADPNAPQFEDKMRLPRVVSKVCEDSAKVTAAETAKGNFMLSIGGDHSIAMGTIAGILKSRPDTGVIWIDAHADINTPETSGSGNVHGMPVAFLMKHPATHNLPAFKWLEQYPTLHPKNLVYIGLRDVDGGEKEIIREFGIKTFSMQDVDKYGISQVMEKAISYLTNDRRTDVPIHLSLDIDGVDPLFAPSTGTRVFGGLTYREAYFICESVAETGLLASMDLVEVNPTLGDSEEAAQRTIKIANGLIASALGNRIL